MPKVPTLRSVSETRSIVVANSLAKWYLTSLTFTLEAEVSGDLQRLGLYGFSLGRSPWEIVGPLKQICQHGSVWGKSNNDQTAYVAQADIKKAFDNITIQVVARALEVLKVHPRLTHGILEPLVGTS
eukprot:4933034-Pyramimonas_sp.AAC.1